MTTVIVSDGPEFNVGDRVRITMGPYSGAVGTVETWFGGTYYVLPEKSRTYLMVPAGYLELVDSGLAKSPVVNILEQGLSSQETADAIDIAIRYFQSRITGAGKDSYGTEKDDVQQFESMSLEDLIEYQLEEIADDVNYAIFRFIRLRRIQEAMKSHL